MRYDTTVARPGLTRISEIAGRLPAGSLVTGEGWWRAMFAAGRRSRG
jgi:hypothetical protein